MLLATPRRRRPIGGGGSWPPTCDLLPSTSVAHAKSNHASTLEATSSPALAALRSRIAASPLRHARLAGSLGALRLSHRHSRHHAHPHAHHHTRQLVRVFEYEYGVPAAQDARAAFAPTANPLFSGRASAAWRARYVHSPASRTWTTTNLGPANPATVQTTQGSSPARDTRPLRTAKRQRDPTAAGDNPPPAKRARLTQENLAILDKMVRRRSLSSAAPASAGDYAASAKTISTTTAGFDQLARDNGILEPEESRPPRNLESFRELSRSRDTASPPESAYRSYAYKVKDAGNEATMLNQTYKRLMLDYDDPSERYNQAFNRPLTGLPKDAGFNRGLSAPQPDFVEGLGLTQFRPFPAHQIEGAALFRDDKRSITLPHIAGEWKGRFGDLDQAASQGGYDGAALVYGRNNALARLGRPDPPGHAEVMTFATDGTRLSIYAHYAAASAETDALEYHQYEVASEDMAGYAGYKAGRRALRNAQDRARATSHALRDDLREAWRAEQRRPTGSSRRSAADTASSLDGGGEARGRDPLARTVAFDDGGIDQDLGRRRRARSVSRPASLARPSKRTTTAAAAGFIDDGLALPPLPLPAAEPAWRRRSSRGDGTRTAATALEPPRRHSSRDDGGLGYAAPTPPRSSEGLLRRSGRLSGQRLLVDDEEDDGVGVGVGGTTRRSSRLLSSRRRGRDVEEMW